MDEQEQLKAQRYTLLLACEQVHDLQGARVAQRQDLATLEVNVAAHREILSEWRMRERE